MNEFYAPLHDENFENGDPTAWVIVSAAPSTRSATRRRRRRSTCRRSATRSCSGTPVRRPPARLADPGLRRRQGVPRGELPRVHDVRRHRPGAVTSPRSAIRRATAGPGTARRPDVDAVRHRPRGRLRRRRSPGRRATTRRMWAATATGRVFVSQNADARCAANVTFTRIDSPRPLHRSGSCRASSVDPTNPNRACISYSGYNTNTPTTPGHVFQVDYNPTTHTATWTDIDNGTGPLGDLPVTGIARDSATGDALRRHRLHRPRRHGGGNGTFEGHWRPAADGHAAGRGGRRDDRPEDADAVRSDARPGDLVARAEVAPARAEDEGPPSGGPSSFSSLRRCS